MPNFPKTTNAINRRSAPDKCQKNRGDSQLLLDALAVQTIDAQLVINLYHAKPEAEKPYTKASTKQTICTAKATAAFVQMQTLTWGTSIWERTYP